MLVMEVTPRRSIHEKGSTISFTSSSSTSYKLKSGKKTAIAALKSLAGTTAKTADEALKSLLTFFLCISFGKLLFIYCYRSSDFEVHRNWLAVTSSLPVRQWYLENTSQWTLDYPPLFAWFEYVLSFGARFFDPQMLRVDNLNYASFNTVLFQRLSVIFADVMLGLGVYRLCLHMISHSGAYKAWVAGLLILSDIGLLMVDHIHFQYNGFLTGFLLLSICSVLKGEYPWAAFWFSVLLNLKHIYLYVAPVYFLYLLRWHCFRDLNLSWRSFSFVRLCQVAIPVLAVTAFSFGPFVYYGQLEQVLRRLFPFKRGLCHAYWAPNFWVFYNLADKAAVYSARLCLGYNITSPVAFMTGGVLKDVSHIVLPSVYPQVTFLLTFIGMLPALYAVWKSPSPWQFVRCVVVAAFASFMFGWHVHEKAILMVLIPMSVVAVVDKAVARVHIVLSIAGYYSLFPLLTEKAEGPIKLTLLIIYILFMFWQFGEVHQFKNSRWRLPGLDLLETLYLLCLLPLLLYNSYGHTALGLDKRYPFIPLLNTSVYCSIGVAYSYIKMLKIVLEDSSNKSKYKKA